MKTFISGLCYLNLFFVSTGTTIALSQVPKFFPELLPYWIFLWVVALLISIALWLPAAIRQQLPDSWLAVIATISLLLLLVDEVRLWLS